MREHRGVEESGKTDTPDCEFDDVFGRGGGNGEESDQVVGEGGGEPGRSAGMVRLHLIQPWTTTTYSLAKAPLMAAQAPLATAKKIQ